MSPLIHPNVHWDKQTAQLGNFVLLGIPPRGHITGELPLIFGSHLQLGHYSVVYAGSHYGSHLKIGNYVTLREDNTIGDHVSIDDHCVLEYGNTIGEYSKLGAGCFLEQTTLQNHVCVESNVVFTDDPHPVCPQYKACKGGVFVGAYTHIGANSTLLPGIRIGSHCSIYPGSVVTQSMPDFSHAQGNPAKITLKSED